MASPTCLSDDASVARAQEEVPGGSPTEDRGLGERREFCCSSWISFLPSPQDRSVLKTSSHWPLGTAIIPGSADSPVPGLC